MDKVLKVVLIGMTLLFCFLGLYHIGIFTITLLAETGQTEPIVNAVIIACLVIFFFFMIAIPFGIITICKIIEKVNKQNKKNKEYEIAGKMQEKYMAEKQTAMDRVRVVECVHCGAKTRIMIGTKAICKYCGVPIDTNIKEN